MKLACGKMELNTKLTEFEHVSLVNNANVVFVLTVHVHACHFPYARSSMYSNFGSRVVINNALKVKSV